MIAPRLQRIFLALVFLGTINATAAELQPGSTAHLVFHDVDGNEHSTAAGRVTVLTVVTRQSEEKAHAVADLVPDHCLGNPKYRYITLVNFQRKLFGPLQGLTKAIIRNRLTAEANKLRPEYVEKKIGHDPRQDLFVVADFDGSAVAQLGLASDSDTVAVFVFNGHGKLIARWNDVPPNDSLGKAIAAAE